MNKENFLVYIDILGFEQLPRELAEKSGIDEDWIRQHAFLSPFQQIIEDLRHDNDVKIDYLKEGSDSCLILIHDLDSVFRIIKKFSDINLPMKIGKPDKGPIEVGIDFVNDQNVICEDPISSQKIISSLKKNFFNDYRQWFKAQNHNSIKNSYIIISESVHQKLENHQKGECEKLPIEDKNLFLLPSAVVDREQKILDFLSMIGKSRSDASGAYIDKIFVPPGEYDEIINSFENERIVFLSGPAGYGKTYLAVRLLWLWYLKGYAPRWIRGGEFYERQEGRTFLEEIDAVNNSNQIIYVEDPFGNVTYEPREKLSQAIEKIIDFVHKKQNIFLILTSKKDVFELFKTDTLSGEIIRNYEKELNFLKHSYNDAQRKLILEMWANLKDCLWYKSPELKQYVFSEIEKPENLPTPLSIHDFAENSIMIQNHDDLQTKIQNYSEVSEKVFAKEIIGIYHSGRMDRVLLLSFVFIFDSIDVDYLKNQYDQLKERNYEDFSKIVQEEYRIIKDFPKFNKGKFDSVILTFSHPSYQAALPIVLIDPGCNEIFCRVLRQLSKDFDSIPYVIGTLIGIFDEIPNNVGNELIQKIYRIHLKKRFDDYLEFFEDYFDPFSELIIRNYDKLNDKNQEMVNKMLTNKEIRRHLPVIIAEDYSNRSETVKKIFNDFIHNPNNFEGAIWAICEYYDKLPKEIQNYLIEIISNKKLMKKNPNAGITSTIIAKCFESLPSGPDAESLKLLSEYSLAGPEVSWTVYDFHDCIPENDRRLIKKNLIIHAKSIQFLYETLASFYREVTRFFEK